MSAGQNSRCKRELVGSIGFTTAGAVVVIYANGPFLVGTPVVYTALGIYTINLRADAGVDPAECELVIQHGGAYPNMGADPRPCVQSWTNTSDTVKVIRNYENGIAGAAFAVADCAGLFVSIFRNTPVF